MYLFVLLIFKSIYNQILKRSLNIWTQYLYFYSSMTHIYIFFIMYLYLCVYSVNNIIYLIIFHHLTKMLVFSKSAIQEETGEILMFALMVRFTKEKSTSTSSAITFSIIVIANIFNVHHLWLITNYKTIHLILKQDSDNRMKTNT